MKSKILILGMCVGIVGIAFFVRRHSIHRVSSAASSGSTQGSTSIKENAPNAGSGQPTAKTTDTPAINNDSKLVVAKWSSISARYGALLPVFAGKSRTALTYALMHNALRWESALYGGDPLVLDHEIRAVATIQTLDFCIASQIGFQFEQAWVGATDPPYYFPVGGTVAPKLPADSAQLESIKEKLLACLRDNSFEEIASTVPPQFMMEGLQDAIRTRVLGFLAAFDPDPKITVALRSSLYTAQSNVEKAMAFTALLSTKAEEEAAGWFANCDNEELKLAILDSLRPDESRLVTSRTEGKTKINFMSNTSTLGRSLDSTLLQQFRSGTDQVRRAIAPSLAGRVDNAEIQSCVFDILKGNDAELQVAVLRQIPNAVSNPDYAPLLQNLLQASDLRVVNWAIVNYSCTGASDAWKHLAPFLLHETRGVAINAAICFGKAALFDKQAGTIALSNALAMRPADPEFTKYANLSLRVLK